MLLISILQSRGVDYRVVRTEDAEEEVDNDGKAYGSSKGGPKSVFRKLESQGEPGLLNTPHNLSAKLT